MTGQPNHPATLLGQAITLLELTNPAAAVFLLAQVRDQDKPAVERGRGLPVVLPMLRVAVGECGRDKAALLRAVRA